MKSIIVGKLLITTCNQGGCAPLLDYGTATADDGRLFHGRVLLLTPWRRNKYGESLPQRALVIGWQGKPVWWNRWRPKYRPGPSTTAAANVTERPDHD